MDLTRLRHILAIARTGSFSRAAEAEGITQPALSRSVAAFEKRHGVILFDRGRSGVFPTPAGMLVIEQARKLLAISGELERSLHLYGTGAAGRVAMGIGPMMASLLLSELARSLLQSHPQLSLVTSVRTPEHLLPELLDDRIEMIIGTGWQIGRAPGITREPLGTLTLGVTVRSDHPLVHQSEVVMADLARFPVASAVELVPEGFGNAGMFVCGNFHILRDTVRHTDCVWLSSPTFVANELDSGDLVQITVADMEPVRSAICILWRQGRTRSPAALAVADQVRAMLASLQSAPTVNSLESDPDAPDW
jgi:DNA-binding transcriptional LysR family regulator